MSDSNPGFPFKFGHVAVHEDRVELENRGVRGGVSRVVVGNSSARARVVQLVLVLFCGWMVWSSANNGQVPLALLYGALGVWLVYWNVRNARFSLAAVLRRDQVSRVRAERGLRFMTVDRLMFHFDQDGRERVRMVVLPTVLQGGSPESLPQAVAVLRGAGWTVED
ncbi:MAG: hypothetical protein ACI8PZ_001358 [Myxococcota bacterium]|jgi:hypothetical protein